MILTGRMNLLIRMIYTRPILHDFGSAILFQFSKLLYHTHTQNHNFLQGHYQEVLQGTKQLTLKISALRLSPLLSTKDSA